MKKIVVENIKDLFQIYFVLQEDNIFMDSKYIFVLYEGWFDANIFLKAIFYANIFCAEGEKKKKETYLQRDIHSKFTGYIFL